MSSVAEGPMEQGVGPGALSDKLGDLAAEAGISKLEIVAWRDLEHPEAGGSEIHAARVAERWAKAGLEVSLVASRAPGLAPRSWADCYEVRRPAGRYGVFPVVVARGLLRRARPDAVVEVWNGMPFFSPLWAPRHHLTLVHHVHERMWETVLPPNLARLGRFVEARLAPPFYRGTRVVTLSESSRQEILRSLGLPPALVGVVPPGVDERFSPGGRRSRQPLVLAVGRLVPYKRFDALVETLVLVKRRHPDLCALIVGEGYERAHLEALVASLGVGSWLRLPGRADPETLLALYRSAWVVASTSAFEGWGLTISEAGACATPAVASPIPGHLDAVRHGVSGFLALPGPEMAERISQVLSDPALRARLGHAARRLASRLSWDATALGLMRELCASPPPATRVPGGQLRPFPPWAPPKTLGPLVPASKGLPDPRRPGRRAPARQ